MIKQKDLKTEDYFGQPVFEWQINEFERYERSNRWYIFMGIICLALIIFAIFTANFLFALIILLFAFIIVLREFYNPEKIDFKISNQGALLGGKLFPYKEIGKFYIIYEPPESKFLYLAFKSLKPTLSVFLADQNPVKIREFLLKYLEEDLEKEDEHIADTLGRLFKI
jgi:hypothetical protein